jgi:hypothetical protein
MPLPPDYRKEESLWYCITHHPKGYEFLWSEARPADAPPTAISEGTPQNQKIQQSQQNPPLLAPQTKGVPSTSSRTSGKWASLLNILSALLSILVILFWYPSFSPNIQIRQHESPNPQSVGLVPFSITNNGLTTIFDVAVGCQFNSFITSGHHTFAHSFITDMPHSHAVSLERSETFDVNCSPTNGILRLPAEDVLTTADLIVVAEFTPRPRFFSGRHVKCAHFTLLGDSMGHMQWLEEPIGPCCCAELGAITESCGSMTS